MADLIKHLHSHLAQYLYKPATWESEGVPEEEKAMVTKAIAQDLFTQLHEIIPASLWHNQIGSWNRDYGRRGSGSATVRRADIREIFNEVVQLDGEKSLREITKGVKDAITENGGKLIS